MLSRIATQAIVPQMQPSVGYHLGFRNPWLQVALVIVRSCLLAYWRSRAQEFVRWVVIQLDSTACKRWNALRLDLVDQGCAELCDPVSNRTDLVHLADPTGSTRYFDPQQEVRRLVALHLRVRTQPAVLVQPVGMTQLLCIRWQDLICGRLLGKCTLHLLEEGMQGKWAHLERQELKLHEQIRPDILRTSGWGSLWMQGVLPKRVVDQMHPPLGLISTICQHAQLLASACPTISAQSIAFLQRLSPFA